jgi:hypothetical protein
MSDPFNVTSQAASSSGKGGGGSGYNWYADIAALICGGPVDALFAIYMNGNIVLGHANGSTISGVQNSPLFTRQTGGTGAGYDYINFTINPTINGTTYNLGTATLYWGTETQPVDADLYTNCTHLLNDNAIELDCTTVPIRHTAYRGFSYIVFHQLSLGFNQTSFPNIEITVGRWPTPDWLDVSAAATNFNNDINPICAVADWLQNPRAGLNIPDALLDIDGLNASAIQLTSEEFGVSPLLDRDQAAKDFITDLCDYFDGFPYISDDGLFGIGLMRVPADPGGLPQITDSLCVTRPEFDSDDWSQAVSECRVTFKNAIYDLTDDYVAYVNPGNRAVNDQLMQPLILDRPYVAWHDFAALMAVGAGLRLSVPKKTGKITLRRTSALDYYDLPIGAQFMFNLSERNTGSLIWRVTERAMQDPAVPQFDITFELDLSYLYPTVDEAQALIPPTSELSPESTPGPTLTDVRVFELPLALCPEGKLSLSILAARNDPAQTALFVWLGRNYEQSWP